MQIEENAKRKFNLANTELIKAHSDSKSGVFEGFICIFQIYFNKTDTRLFGINSEACSITTCRSVLMEMSVENDISISLLYFAQTAVCWKCDLKQ